MTCKLCQGPGPLRNSHVIPEFLHATAYDEKHRIGLTESGGRMRLLQKGVREPLLCAACEHLINTRYEQPIARVWQALLPEALPRDVHLLEGLDYQVFKLFHLSILWRASVAGGPEWSQVSLGSRHEEALRQILLQERVPERTRYPVLGTVFLRPETRQPATDWIMPPVSNRFGPAWVYSTMYAGCTWHVVVASHVVVDSSNPFVLSESGQIGLPVHDIMELSKIDIGRQIRFRSPPS
jgi:hypothetical protein